MRNCHFATAIFLLITFGIGFSEPNGAVLYRNGKRIGHINVPPTAEHHYFGYLEGPAWENKYSTFRTYVDKDDRNTIDIIGKFKGEAILHNFSDTTVDQHKSWQWGTDILSVGSSMGLGSFRLFNNGTWINPQIPENLDSLVLTIVDSSVQTPKINIGYYGWNIGSSKKIDVLWTISTSLEERPVHCELAITGEYTGSVVVGMVNHKENSNNPNSSNISIIKDENPPLLATLGKQGGLSEGFADTLLMAITTEESYFNSFVTQGTTNLGMILTPDAGKKVKWSFAYSWAREESPLYRNPNWKDVLRSTTHALPHVRQKSSAVSNAPLHPLQGEYFTLSGKYIGSSIDALHQKVKPGVYVTKNSASRLQLDVFSRK